MKMRMMINHETKSTSSPKSKNCNPGDLNNGIR